MGGTWIPIEKSANWNSTSSIESPPESKNGCSGPEAVPCTKFCQTSKSVAGRSNVSVVEVSWGPNVDPAVTAALPGFYTAITGSLLLGAIGCNDVSRHDAVISVRAGFADHELSALWPASSPYRLEEYAAGLFSHCFVAQRMQRDLMNGYG